jgi:hypothetical protein
MAVTSFQEDDWQILLDRSERNVKQSQTETIGLRSVCVAL